MSCIHIYFAGSYADVLQGCGNTAGSRIPLVTMADITSETKWKSLRSCNCWQSTASENAHFRQIGSESMPQNSVTKLYSALVIKRSLCARLCMRLCKCFMFVSYPDVQTQNFRCYMYDSVDVPVIPMADSYMYKLDA